MAETITKEIAEFLERNDISFERHKHAPVFTCEEGSKIAQSVDSSCCKSLLLKRKDRFFLFVLEANRRFNAKEASAFLNCGHLSFASPKDLERLMCTFPGAVSLLGLMFDRNNEIELIIDQAILSSSFVNCHPCTNEESWKIEIREILNKFLPALHKEFRVYKHLESLLSKHEDLS